MRFLRRVTAGAVMACLVAGMVLIAIQSVWITYGVFVRYVLGRPDGVVTEATALMLVPLAFLGLPYALKEDGFPKVTFLTDHIPHLAADAVGKLNLVIMIVIGGFFTAATGNAALSTYQSGVASSVLGWPEYLLWAPVAISSGVFVLQGAVQLFSTSVVTKVRG